MSRQSRKWCHPYRYWIQTRLKISHNSRKWSTFVSQIRLEQVLRSMTGKVYFKWMIWINCSLIWPIEICQSSLPTLKKIGQGHQRKTLWRRSRKATHSLEIRLISTIRTNHRWEHLLSNKAALLKGCWKKPKAVLPCLSKMQRQSVKYSSNYISRLRSNQKGTFPPGTVQTMQSSHLKQ